MSDEPIARSPEAAQALSARLARCYTGAVHDVLRMMGHENIVLPPQIKPIAAGTKLAGPVWTVAGRIDGGARDRLSAEQSRGRADG